MSLSVDRIFIAVLMLSISGFVCCAVFLPLEKLAYRFSSARMMVFVNTAALLSFVIPFYMVVSILDRSEYLFQRYSIMVFTQESAYEALVGKVRELGLTDHLDIVWLSGAVLFLGFHMRQYMRLSDMVRKSSFSMEGSKWAEIFDRLKAETPIRNLQLIGSSSISTPCTIGIRKRYIVIPAGMLSAFDEEEISLILQHELYHAAHYDLQRNFLLTIFNCLNWFNPLYYFLRNTLSDWMEAACDEEVTRKMDQEQRRRYCQLILKILELEQNAENKGRFVMGFSGANVRSRKERMLYVMQNTRSADWRGKVLIVIATGLSVFWGNAVAKEADVAVNQMFSKKVTIITTEDIEIIDDPDYSIMDEFTYTPPSADSVYTEFVLCDTEDTTYELLYDGEPPTIGASTEEHTHSLRDMNIKEHIVNDVPEVDGICVTTQYEGRICTVCGMVWKGNDTMQLVEYKECNHIEP